MVTYRLLTKLKERIQLLLIGEAKFAHRIGLKPNHLSLIGVFAALVSAYLFWSSQFQIIHLPLAALCLLISGFFDALDGVSARLYGETTLFGGFLDSLLDRYSDALILGSIILGWLATSSLWLLIGIAALTGSLLVSYTRARAEAAGVKMETVGLAERAERLLIIVIASLLTLVWQDALRWSVALLAVLTNLTVLQRAVYFRKASKKKEATTPVI
jgi:archaetidylinositol phosphate synthase